jgi:YVTN family beta-propeller protein
MIKERAWSIRRLTGRSFLPVIGSLCNLTTDPLTGRVYVTDAARHAVLVIDGRTNQAVATVPGTGGDSRIATDPVANRVYVTNTFAHSVSVLAGSG